MSQILFSFMTTSFRKPAGPPRPARGLGPQNGEGTRAGRIGALLVGVHDRAGDGGPLRYAGRVGTGFTEPELARLAERTRALATDDCPFDPPPPRADLVRGATWLRPELVAEVAYGEWTEDHRLRHPSYLGLRIDKDPGDVTRDP